MIIRWGETPWDNMTEEQLRREVQRMYSALLSVTTAFAVDRVEMEPYWGPEGVGGRALEKARQVIEPIEQAYGAEALFRCFYRYADDLLFDSSRARIGSGWAVCPICGAMRGRRPSAARQPCDQPGCNGTLRLLTWEDLKPEKAP